MMSRIHKGLAYSTMSSRIHSAIQRQMMAGNMQHGQLDAKSTMPSSRHVLLHGGPSECGTHSSSLS
jgi:hypothetical protein